MPLGGPFASFENAAVHGLIIPSPRTGVFKSLLAASRII